MRIIKIDEEFSICKVRDYNMVNMNLPYTFISKTPDENSLVCLTKYKPVNTIKASDGYMGFYIEGELDFSLIGILAKITSILADNKIPVFAISTYNTDYVLVNKDSFEKAIELLALNGYSIE